MDASTPSTSGPSIIGKGPAANLAARRAAGVYGPKRHRRQMLVTAAGIAAGLAIVAFLIV